MHSDLRGRTERGRVYLLSSGLYVVLGIALLLLTGPLYGCGGGTSGTGGGLDVNGVLRAVDGPLAGVQVSVTNQIAKASTDALTSRTDSAEAEERTISTDVTDADGKFLLALDSHPSAFILSFHSPEIDAEFPVQNIPANSANLVLELEYNREGKLIVEIEEKFEDEAGEELREHERGENASH